jgi:tetratricopeptide (TPR) repeat protein
MLALLAWGCNLQRFTANLTAPVIANGSRSFDAEGDIEIARAAAPGQLKTTDGLLETIPDSRILLELLAKGYLQVAFGFLEDDLESLPDSAPAEQRQVLTARATALYDRALGYALRLLDTRHTGFSAAFRGDLAQLAAAIARTAPADAPALLYGGMATASAVNLNRADPSRAVDLPKAVAMLERARELDPRLWHGGASMVLGIVYGSQPPALGGDPARSKRYFDEAIAVDGGRYLMAPVMLARAYAVAAKDRALFEATLRRVLATDAGVLPEARLANTFARRRALRYLDRAPQLF